MQQVGGKSFLTTVQIILMDKNVNFVNYFITKFDFWTVQHLLEMFKSQVGKDSGVANTKM